MIKIRKAKDRGRSQFSWLDSYHSFSFGDYYDPANMAFGPLRVINDDRVAGGGGFPTHPHRDMEIITYVLEGALAHKDSLGTSSLIKPGEIQRMTAGTGIRHSEFNASPSEPVHLLQIWLLPERQGLEPGYEQKETGSIDGKLSLIASREGRGSSITIHQSADVYASRLSAGQTVTFPLPRGRLGYLQVARGELELNGQKLGPGDGAAIRDEKLLTLKGVDKAEVLLFDMADGDRA